MSRDPAAGNSTVPRELQGSVLIVDRDTGSAQALATVLRSQSYDTHAVAGIVDALAVLRENQFDLLLSELNLADGDGISLLGQALAVDPQLVGILMSVNPTVETAVLAMKAGAVDFISKAAGVDTLVPLIARAMAIRALKLENLELRDTVAIHELNKAIAHALDLDVLLDKIVEVALKQFEADESSLMLLSDDGRSLTIAAVKGGKREKLLGLSVSVDEGVAGWVARNREPRILVGKLDDNGYKPQRRRADIKSAMCLPLITRNKLIGILNVSSTHSGKILTPGQLSLIAIFTNPAATAIEAARLNAIRRRTDSRYRNVLDMAADAIISLDQDLRIIIFNASATRIFGWANAAALGQSLDILIPQRYLAQHRRMVLDFMTDTQSTAAVLDREPITALRSDGTEFPAEISMSRMREDDQVVFTAVLRDVTNRYRLERELRELNESLEDQVLIRTNELAVKSNQLEQQTVELERARHAAEAANRAKSAFLATMSHEIRTPLNAIVGIIELLERSMDPEDFDRMLPLLRESSKALTRIINDILDLSKIEAGQLEISPEPMSVEEVLAESVALFTTAADSKGLYIRQQTNGTVPALVHCDPLRLKQILFNLLSNAIKFTAHGGITLTLQATVTAAETAQLCIEVTDTGIGISAEGQTRLFQPFVQAESTIAQKFGGTGLGLVISRRLASLLDGSLELRSKPGKGTTMKLLLRTPVLSAMPANMQRGSAADEQLNVTGRGQRVLIVDDNSINRIVLQNQLQKLGYQPAEAESGITALQLLKEGNFALLITDCQMPDMDGFALARRIRAGEAYAGNRVRIPIIGYTANIGIEVTDSCRAAGMDEVLFKPVGIRDLGAKLAMLLGSDQVAMSAAPESATQKVEAPIDWELLDEITGNDRNFALELLQTFLAEKEPELALLLNALAQGYTAETARLAHRMKGAARMIAANVLAELCNTLELPQAEGAETTTETTAARLIQEFGRVRSYIEQGDTAGEDK